MTGKKTFFFYAGMLATLIALLLCPELASSSVRDGLRLCLDRIIPALFPYLVLSNLFLRSGGAQSLGRRIGGWMPRLFHIGESGIGALLLGLTGGYPVGAKAAAQLCREKTLGKKDAERLLSFCNNAGPAFLFGMVGGGCYRSVPVGAALYGVHVVSALICGFILRGKAAPSANSVRHIENPPPFTEAFLSAVTDAGRTLFPICLYVTFFSVALGLVKPLCSGLPLANVLLASVLELSSGCSTIAASPFPWTLKFCLTAAALGWGGVCVHLQTMAAIRGSGLSIRPHLRGKLLHALLSALLALPLSALFEPAVQTAAISPHLQVFSPWPWTAVSIGMACLIFLQITTSNSETNRL